MTCSCTSSKLKQCSYRLYGCPMKGDPVFPAQVVVGQLGRVEQTDPYHFRRPQEKGSLYKIFELLYVKCAAYNLRYCPLRKAVDKDKCLINAAKDLVVLTCFLVANLVVFITILTRTALHLLAILKATSYGIKKYFTTTDNDIPINFANAVTLAKHDFTPPRFNVN